MNISLYRNLIVIIFISSFGYAQNSSQEKILEMKNSFALGLNQKGLEIASELMSQQQYSDIREEAVFFIAEYFFTSALLMNETEIKFDFFIKAYTYYLTHFNDYPNSKNSDIVDKRINHLNSISNEFSFLRNLLDVYENDAVLVSYNLKFATILYSFDFPNPFSFFLEDKSDVKTIDVLDRYFDNIIINYPEFEIYGYYWKIVTSLAPIRDFNYIGDGLLKVNSDRFSLFTGKSNLSDDANTTKSKTGEWLRQLKKKYPNHHLTLDLCLILAKSFLRDNAGDKIFSLFAKENFEFVVQNELDKTHPRYLLTKEFLLNNKFK